MKYVILRDPQRRLRPGDGTVTFRGPGRSSAPPSLEVADADARDRAELGRDPEVSAVAALMPTKLIEPREAGGGNGDGDSGAAGGDGDSWGISAVRADVSQFTGAGVRVAVLDTGIDRAHPAFAGVDILEENFTGDGDGDKRGHGTHCAGTIFGRDVDGTRIGVARGVEQALIGKVVGDDGRGDTVALYEGLLWAMSQRAQVISMSIGFDFPGMVRDRIAEGWPADLATSVTLETYRGNIRMFDQLMGMIRSGGPARIGSVVVAAAGNESLRDVHPEYEIGVSLPAAAEGVLSAGALESWPDGYRIASYSNTFPELCAPGTDIRSAVPGGGLGLMSGTSMACPHVAGLAALWWEAQHASRLPPTAAAVAGKITAACRLDVLAPGTDPAARGNGMATAP